MIVLSSVNPNLASHTFSFATLACAICASRRDIIVPGDVAAAGVAVGGALMLALQRFDPSRPTIARVSSE